MTPLDIDSGLKAGECSAKMAAGAFAKLSTPGGRRRARQSPSGKCAWM